MTKAGKGSPQKNVEPRACVVCGSTFTPYRSWVVACSRPCRDRNRGNSAYPYHRKRSANCTICGVAFDYFTSTRRLYCDDCKPLAEAAMNRRKNVARTLTDDKTPEQSRKIRRKNLASAIRRYGITVEQFEQMMERQQGCCAICGDPPDPNGVKAASRLHIDHDHNSGQVRELLCNHCNRGVGAFRDDPDIMRKAIAYIEGHRT